MSHIFSFKTYLEDTDALGIVYYANYLKFFERARTEYLTTLGVDHATMISNDGGMFVVRHMDIAYLKPAKLGETLCVKSVIENISGVRLNIRQAIEKNDSIFVKAHIQLVLVDQHLKPKAIHKTKYFKLLEDVKS